MIVAGLDSHEARPLGGAKPDGEQRPERDRNLTENVAGTSLADDAVDAVDDLDCLDAAVEEREQCAFVAFVRGVFAGREADVGRDTREPRTRGLFELAENTNAADVVSGDHRSRVLRRRERR